MASWNLSTSALPSKRALLLSKPTLLQEVPPVDVQTLKDVVTHVGVGMTLMQVLQKLQKMGWSQTQTLSGPHKHVSLTGKVETMSLQKMITAAGRQRTVSSMEVVDQDGSVVEVHVWDEAHDHIDGVKEGQGITIIG